MFVFVNLLFAQRSPGVQALQRRRHLSLFVLIATNIDISTINFIIIISIIIIITTHNYYYWYAYYYYSY